MQDRKIQVSKMTDKSVGLENAGQENDRQKCKAGKCKTGKWRTKSTGGLKRTDKIKTYVIYFVS